MRRYARQMRLALVGRDGQRALEAARVTVPGSGVEAETAARYVVGAGVLRLDVGDAAVAASARALDARVDAAVGTESPPASMPDLDELDPAARAVARGARGAVRALVAILRTAAKE